MIIINTDIIIENNDVQFIQILLPFILVGNAKKIICSIVFVIVHIAIAIDSDIMPNTFSANNSYCNGILIFVKNPVQIIVTYNSTMRAPPFCVDDDDEEFNNTINKNKKNDAITKAITQHVFNFPTKRSVYLAITMLPRHPDNVIQHPIQAD